MLSAILIGAFVLILLVIFFYHVNSVAKAILDLGVDAVKENAQPPATPRRPSSRIESGAKAAAPPAGEADTAGSAFVPATEVAVERAVTALLPEDEAAHVARFCDMVALHFHLKFDDVRERLTRAYDEGEGARADADLLWCLEKCNFDLLSAADATFAAAADFELTAPMKTDFAKLDSRLLERFTEASPALMRRTAATRAELAERGVFVWHRGVGVAKKSGQLTLEKVDAIVGQAYDWILRKVLSSPVWRFLPGAVVLPEQLLPGGGAATDNADADEAGVARTSLKSHGSLLKNFFKPLTIQEPTMQEVVVVYRSRDDDPAAPLHLKAFRNIPFADLEIVVPHSEVLFKPMDFLLSFTAAALGLFYIGADFFAAAFGGGGSPVSEATKKAANAAADGDAGASVTLTTAILGLLAYASKTYWDVTIRLHYARAAVTETLYDKAAFSGRGVLLYLVDAVRAQEWKETVIAWSALSLAGRKGLDEAALQRACDALVNGLRGDVAGEGSVVFETADALAKLNAMGLAAERTGKRGVWRCKGSAKEAAATVEALVAGKLGLKPLRLGKAARESRTLSLSPREGDDPPRFGASLGVASDSARAGMQAVPKMK